MEDKKPGNTSRFSAEGPEGLLIRPIARIRSDLPEKFGIPRQSGLVPSLVSRVVFEPGYADPSAVRGLEDFSHIWLIWEFTEAKRKGKTAREAKPGEKKEQPPAAAAGTWTPTVRPPRLGGNERMGVFATRSPFRPNPLGLSCVELRKIEYDTEEGPVLIVGGADLMDRTPIYDIKPYLPYADCVREARSGFTACVERKLLHVEFPETLRGRLPSEKLPAAIGILEQDPRPAYQHDPERIYGVAFAGTDIRFRVEGEFLTVVDVLRKD